MLAQLFAMIVAFGLTFCLLGLRHFIMATGKDRRKYYRAYIVGFDETDDHFGKAIPQESAIEAKLQQMVLPLADAGQTPVMGGFIGATAAGVTVHTSAAMPPARDANAPARSRAAVVSFAF